MAVGEDPHDAELAALRRRVAELELGRQRLVEQWVGQDPRLAHDELRRLHRELSYAREQERAALAREVHESLGQGLIALRLALQTVLLEAGTDLPSLARERLRELGLRLEELIVQARRVSHGLYPTTLEGFGLCSALLQLADAGGNEVEVFPHCTQQMRTLRFRRELEIVLFRAAQEALDNALRHGRARHVRIALRHRRGRLELRVSDDGAGFDPHRLTEGLGLRGVRASIEAEGGTLRLHSRPGRTIFTAAIPAEPL